MVCVCVCIRCVCVHACMYIYVHICLYGTMCVHACMSMCVCVCACVCVCVWIHNFPYTLQVHVLTWQSDSYCRNYMYTSTLYQVPTSCMTRTPQLYHPFPPCPISPAVSELPEIPKNVCCDLAKSCRKPTGMDPGGHGCQAVS